MTSSARIAFVTATILSILGGAFLLDTLHRSDADNRTDMCSVITTKAITRCMSDGSRCDDLVAALNSTTIYPQDLLDWLLRNAALRCRSSLSSFQCDRIVFALVRKGADRCLQHALYCAPYEPNCKLFATPAEQYLHYTTFPNRTLVEMLACPSQTEQLMATHQPSFANTDRYNTVVMVAIHLARFVAVWATLCIVCVSFDIFLYRINSTSKPRFVPTH